MKKNILYIAIAAMLSACGDEDATLDVVGLFCKNGEPVNTRFEQSMDYNQTQGEIHLDMTTDTYTIYVCSDSHITRNRHKSLDQFIDAYNAASEPKLAIHLGDLIDAQNNFACADSVLRLANGPLFITPGNHDLYFKQWEIFRSYFHTGTYWFDTRNGDKKLDLFICLDSGDGTLGTMQTKWLRQLLREKSQEGYRRIIVYTHTHFWKLDNSQEITSNFATEETYELASLFAQYGVDFVWSGHQHARQSVFFKGVRYLVLDATKDTEPGLSYIVMTMGDTVSYEFVEIKK
jgi:predicted phosphodiesterase